jgi:hypothetical protein
MIWPHQRELQRLIDSFIESLMSGSVIEEEQMAQCHAAKLMLERNKEIRVRSLQTLARMQHRSGVAPLFREMMTYARAWPGTRKLKKSRIDEASHLLAEAFGEYCHPHSPD